VKTNLLLLDILDPRFVQDRMSPYGQGFTILTGLDLEESPDTD